MGISGKILKCAISWTWLILERSRWKFGTRSSRKCIYEGYLLRFSKGFWFPQASFYPSLTKRHWTYDKQGGMQAITYLAICQIKKNIIIMAVWFFLLTQDHMHWYGLEISESYFYNVIRSQANFMRTLATMVKTWLYFSWQSATFRDFVALWNFNFNGSMGKPYNMHCLESGWS